MDQPEVILKTLYYDSENPASFGCANRLYFQAKKIVSSLTLKDVKRWLKGQDTYTMFEQVRKKFQRLRMLVDDFDEQ